MNQETRDTQTGEEECHRDHLAGKIPYRRGSRCGLWGTITIAWTSGWKKKGHTNFFPFLILLKRPLSLSKVEGVAFEEVSSPSDQIIKQKLDHLWVEIQV